jgi:hypothetical protein
MAEELLAGGQPMLAEYVDHAGLKSLLKDFFDNNESSQRVWSMLSAEVWLRAYFGEKIETSVLS